MIVNLAWVMLNFKFTWRTQLIQTFSQTTPLGEQSSFISMLLSEGCGLKINQITPEMNGLIVKPWETNV